MTHVYQVIGTSIKNIVLSEAICCCLQTCNVAASEEIVGE